MADEPGAQPEAPSELSTGGDSTGESPAPGPASLELDIDLVYADRVNFAMQQNGVALVDRVRLVSRAAEPVGDLRVGLALANGDAEPWSGRLDSIAPESAAVIVPEGFGLSARAIATRSEAERSEIVCTVTSDAGVVTKSFPIDLLAFDQWPGVGHYPELTAAFVTPNHEGVASMLGAVRQALGGLSESDAIDGYQSGSRKRATLIAEACFNALAARNPGYISPPASFETEGQRVRLVDRVLREGFGTCLDLSLLLMGLCEQCGLHPLILMPEGHAMPAVWTHDAHMAEAVIDDPSRVRNLIDLGEVVPIESTLVTQRGATFAQAVEAATRKMASPGAAFHAIDVRASRTRGVRPLPLRSGDGDGGVDLGALERPAARAGTALDRVELADRAEAGGRASDRSTPGEPAENAPERIARWQSHLLDLSLRNRLLNFRETSATLPLSVPDLPALEDRLADGGRFLVRPKSSGEEPFLADELRAGRVYTTETEGETQKRLLNLYRQAKSSIEETGANVLYLTLGMLRWYESDTSDQPRYAPLILLPVTLKRGSGPAGYAYTVSLSDEPLRPNVTLLEKLRADFAIESAGIDDLPEDEHGLDVDLILRNFTNAIRERKRWEVERRACLGLFSFNKFLMWKDLQDNLENLQQSRLVRHLVEKPGQDFDPDPFPRADLLDDELEPGDLLCTRDADSSQLAAVRSAAQGRTFVLEGPPGTGKSQTIANIIADALAGGRRVLFVAEKMAALSVVRKRLEDDGLGPFCLELHSAKASKKEVLAQLERALGQASDENGPEDWDRLCRELGATRKQLNDYVRELHRPRGIGRSLYGVLGKLSRLGDGPAIDPPGMAPSAATKDDLDRWLGAIGTLTQRAAPVDPPAAYPLRGIGRSSWGFALTEEARDAVGDARTALAALGSAATALAETAGAGDTMDAAGPGAVQALAVAAHTLQKCPGADAGMTLGPKAETTRAAVAEAVRLGRERDTRRTALLARYREEFLELDFLVHIDAVRRLLARPALLRLLLAGGVKKRLRVYARDRLPPLQEVASDLETARDLKKIQADIAGNATAAAALGDAWKGGEADWDAAEQKLAWAEAFSKPLAVLAADRATARLAERLARTGADPEAARAVSGPARRLVECWNTWNDAWKRVKLVLETNSAMAFGAASGAWLERAGRTLERWAGALGELNTWCAWRAARAEAEGVGLGQLVGLYESGGCRLGELEDAFWRGFGRAWFNEVADSVGPIRGFNAAAHTGAIESFRKLDNRAIRLTREVVAAKLRAAAPSAPAHAAAQSEVGILRRQLQLQRRHMPTRRLIESLPTLLPRLKPCFLMSPLSVAQFLDSGLPPFDLVVFDEASQIPVWDSIGAIARGKEVVVVGDSKQLPPTSFFSRLDGSEDEDADAAAVEDMESILKECNAAGVKGLRLRWHYRSRHETLIAFSNHHYYQNELHTFPSPEDRSEALGVTMRYVEDGVYDRGGSRTNRVEARRVVDEVVRQLRDPDSTDSIGIVTFSQAQQQLIEDLLDAERREHPEIEPFFGPEVHEPVFVKNLENVQGDERDAIIFSIGYGPDSTGRASMNFGPLNRDGGERRLNVAVTRARRRLIVFTSLRSDDINIHNTLSLGVRHFKSFLDYAERGPRALTEAVTFQGTREHDSEFEKSVCAALEAKGWEIDAQVGCAGYRIDLGVRHPDKPGRYLAGIECDGATYHSASTARDRDRLRQAVLEGLGWRIERVWSTDWWVNPSGCIDKLDHALRDALQNPEPAAPTDPGPPDVGPAPETGEQTGQTGQTEHAGHVAPLLRAAPAPVTPRRPVYEVSRVSLPELSGGALYEPQSWAKLVSAFEQIVRCEAPIVEELALQRMADACGVRRVTDRFRDRFAQIAQAATGARRVQLSSGVYWTSDQSPSKHEGFRTPGPDERTARDIELIPLAEIANAAEQVIREQFGLPRADLVRETLQLFGVQRATSRTSGPVERAIKDLIRAGRAVDNDGLIGQPV